MVQNCGRDPHKRDGLLTKAQIVGSEAKLVAWLIAKVVNCQAAVLKFLEYPLLRMLKELGDGAILILNFFLN